MRGRVIRLGPGECADAETGARFFAALAFPGADEAAARQDAVAAYVASYLHNANRVDKTNVHFADNRLKAFADLSPQWAGARLRTAKRRLRDRYALAHALRPWVLEALGQPQSMPKGIDKFTQEKITLWLHDDQEERANNFRKRAWRPGLPVAHIVIASDLIFSPAGKNEMEFYIDLAHVAPIETIVTLARHIEALVCRVPRFKISPDKLLHLEWVA